MAHYSQTQIQVKVGIPIMMFHNFSTGNGLVYGHFSGNVRCLPFKGSQMKSQDSLTLKRATSCYTIYISTYHKKLHGRSRVQGWRYQISINFQVPLHRELCNYGAVCHDGFPCLLYLVLLSTYVVHQPETFLKAMQQVMPTCGINSMMEWPDPCWHQF